MKESNDLPGELGDDPRDELRGWVNVELPWYNSARSPDDLLFEAMTRKFNEWYRAERERRFGKDPMSDWSTGSISERVERAEKIAPELEARERFADPTWLDDIKLKYSDTDVLRLAETRHRRGLEAIWSAQDETCRGFQEMFAARQQAEKRWRAQTEFRSHPMCKPGVLIDVRTPVDDGFKLERLLIGDINSLGGTCDDCAIAPETLVLRYYDLNISRVP